MEIIPVGLSTKKQWKGKLLLRHLGGGNYQSWYISVQLSILLLAFVLGDLGLLSTTGCEVFSEGLVSLDNVGFKNEQEIPGLNLWHGVNNVT